VIRLGFIRVYCLVRLPFLSQTSSMRFGCHLVMVVIGVVLLSLRVGSGSGDTGFHPFAAKYKHSACGK
jgi:hypothetical protein